jgi:chaperonin GroEL (HSP60 family)
MVNEGEGKKNAQTHNIRAARQIVDTVKTTLGPMGMDKMLVDGGGNVIVTNDGATILRELDVAHPGGKMIVEVAKMQESLCYDGTTSTVVLAGQLLANSEMLFEKGLHPNVICRGYHEASQVATEYLNDLACIHPNVIEEEGFLIKIAKTAITGKTLETSLDTVSQLCVDAVTAAGNADNVRVLSLPGGSIDDSYLFNGVVLNKDIVGGSEEGWNLNDGNYALLNTGLEIEKNDDNVQVQLDAQTYQSFKDSGKNDLLAHAQNIVTAFNNTSEEGGGVLFVRDGVAESVSAYLRKNGVEVVQRLPESSMKALSNALGVEIAYHPETIGYSSGLMIRTEKHNDVNYLFVRDSLSPEDCVGESTLILRGATNTTLDEVERGFDDALGVVSLVLNNGGAVHGGGSAYVAMASHLRTRAASIGGRAQMAIEAFADALESISATIAENAGHDPLDTVLAMRHALLNNKISMGPDVNNGGITCMSEQGVVEPAELVRQAVLSATEVTNAILRIDDIIGRRPVE